MVSRTASRHGPSLYDSDEWVFCRSVTVMETQAIVLWSTWSAEALEEWLGHDDRPVASPPALQVMIAAMLRRPALEMVLDATTRESTGPAVLPLRYFPSRYFSLRYFPSQSVCGDDWMLSPNALTALAQQRVSCCEPLFEMLSGSQRTRIYQSGVNTPKITLLHALFVTGDTEAIYELARRVSVRPDIVSTVDRDELALLDVAQNIPYNFIGTTAAVTRSYHAFAAVLAATRELLRVIEEKTPRRPLPPRRGGLPNWMVPRMAREMFQNVLSDPSSDSSALEIENLVACVRGSMDEPVDLLRERLAEAARDATRRFELSTSSHVAGDVTNLRYHLRHDVNALVKALRGRFASDPVAMKALMKHLIDTSRADLAALTVAAALSVRPTCNGFSFRELLTQLQLKEDHDRLRSIRPTPVVASTARRTPVVASTARRRHKDVAHFEHRVLAPLDVPLMALFDDEGTAVLRSAGNLKKLPHFSGKPHILLRTLHRPPEAGQPATCDRDTFTTRWRELTRGLFDKWRWNNTVAFGSAVTFCLLPEDVAELQRPDAIELAFFGGDEFRDDDPQLRAAPNADAIAICCGFLERHVRSTVGPSNYAVIMARECMIILFADPLMPRVTVKLGHWRDVAEVLESRDVDAESVAYLGDGVVKITGRGALAWVHRLNTPVLTGWCCDKLVHPYEIRLWQQARHFGFAVYDVLHQDRDAKDEIIAAAYAAEAEVRAPACPLNNIEWMILVERNLLIPDTTRFAHLNTFEGQNVAVTAANAVVGLRSPASPVIHLVECEHPLDDRPWQFAICADRAHWRGSLDTTQVVLRSQLEHAVFQWLEEERVWDRRLPIVGAWTRYPWPRSYGPGVEEDSD
jgi:hypothetical protein